ncbi:MAG: ATP synthase F1 subunit delta [Flavobacteriales bacterium]
MQDSKAVYRYAKALFELANEQNVLERVHADMQLIQQAIKENRDLRVLIKSPVVKFDKKNEIFDLIFAKHISPLTKSFMNLVIKKQREGNLADVVTQFHRIYLENNNIEEVYLTTSVELGQPFKDEIVNFVKKDTKNKVQLEEKIDPSIIGGFILKYSGKQFNASVARKLEMMRQELNKKYFEKKL